MATDSYAKLESFIAAIKRSGMPRSSHFHVIIGGSFGGEIATKDVMMMCDATNIPGYSHMTAEARRFGEIVEMPYGITYPDVNMSFYVDNTAQTKQYFDTWSNAVFNKRSRTVGFYRDYVRDIDMFITDAGDNVVYHVKLFEAFPQNISDFNVDFANHDIIKVQVLMKYKWIETVYSSANGDQNKNAQYKSQQSLASVSAVNLSTNFDDRYFLSDDRSDDLFGDKGVYSGPSMSLTGNVPALNDTGVEFVQYVPRAGIMTETAILASSMPTNLATSTRAISNQSVVVGSNIIGLSQNPSNPTQHIAGIAAGASALASSVVTLNGHLGAVGAGVSGLISTAANLTTTANRLSSISSFNDAQNVIMSLGSNFSALGGQIMNVSNSIKSVPGYSSSVGSGFANFGSAFSSAGSNLSSSMADLYYG